ncbi:hypothetical protein [Aureivirga sp. CE67]|uniref:hypothetical protein n=1 Tax=Aureivirga sp. CE67 TaxID=1788983 RepID=UPI001E478423|nr:hypothetical protein [Aureivirga sp. CE67]
MRKGIKILIVFIVIFQLISCNKIKNKSVEISSKTKEKVENKIDKVFPTFDSYHTDTDNNKKRFKDFLKIDISKDVKNIYCYSNELGLNSKYMFSFNCKTETSEKIKSKHHLIKDTLNLDSYSLQKEFDWWNIAEIKKLQKFSWKENQIIKEFWYDNKNQKAYFFEFDL